MDLSVNHDYLGDAISQAERLDLQQKIMEMLELPRQDMTFPGSHPVSLDSKSKLQVLRQHHYSVTWKADGTRYMLLLLYHGCYLIDKRWSFRRLQMRFPLKDDVSSLHNMTLLDGEVVVDADPMTAKLKRTFLVHDMMVVNSESLIKRSFSERFRRIESEVIKPKNEQRALRPEIYEAEEIRVSRKDYWPLWRTKYLLDQFIPKLSNPAKGLIFQGWDHEYANQTSDRLLWKFPRLNSVHFYLQRSEDHYSLSLLERGLHQVLQGASVMFDDTVDPSTLDKKVIECSWNKERQAWQFVRPRSDMLLADPFDMYRKVCGSISNKITQEQIIKLPIYMDKKCPTEP